MRDGLVNVCMAQSGSGTLLHEHIFPNRILHSQCHRKYNAMYTPKVQLNQGKLLIRLTILCRIPPPFTKLKQPFRKKSTQTALVFFPTGETGALFS